MLKADTQINFNDDGAIIRFVQQILIDAVLHNASDIHFEPYENFFRIRMRIDGILHEIMQPSFDLTQRIIARLKVMSRLDIAEKRLPQDGRFTFSAEKISKECRISSCPTLFGEKIVVRILDSTQMCLSIKQLELESQQQQIFLHHIQQPQGMILVTGPTGSGKTITLYTALNLLNTLDENISTVEDPVEINLSGINQVPVNPKIGLTFSTALRAFLRQDPDIIMVGEIRDLETAEIAIRAAQTGHLVLSTLHTNSAPETITRLLNMGISAFNIASSVSLIIAQRLVRKLCDSCKQPQILPEKTLLEAGFHSKEINDLKIFMPTGCKDCIKGYKGRIGIFELMPMTESLAQLILAENNSLAIAEHARENGTQSLYESALNKVRQGVTSLEEINRVVSQ